MSLIFYFSPIDSAFLNKEATGLGNTLFQISSLYSISKEIGKPIDLFFLKVLNKKILNLTGDDYSKTIFRNFITNEEIYLKNIHYYDHFFRSNMYKTYIIPHEYNGDFVSNITRDIASFREDLFICGYMESYKFFIKYEYELKQKFQPDELSREYIYSKYPELKNEKTVSIHVRNLHPMFKPNINYIKKALDYFDNEYTFFIVSDDIDNIKEKFTEINKNFTFVTNLTDYQDLWLMSMCKNNILSQSTLSWWGAFLNLNIDKIVIAPKEMEDYYKSPIKNLYYDDYILLK
jgi:hypothetical protein